MVGEVIFMPSSYEAGTVAASVLMAMFASFVALDLAKRVRTADVALARAWLIGGSVTMGLGIWAMHFVGMMAFRLPVAVGYDVLFTLVSALAAVGGGSARSGRSPSHESPGWLRAVEGR